MGQPTTFRPTSAPPRWQRVAASITQGGDFIATSRCECFKNGECAGALAAGGVGNRAHAAVAHAEVGALRVIRPDGVEGAVILHRTELVDSRPGAVAANAGTVDRGVAARGGEGVLDAA